MVAPSLMLPDDTGRLVAYTPHGTPIAPPPPPHHYDRTVFAAAHVVADPLAAREPGEGAAIDWNGTIAFRRHLLDLGFGIAEAMDTAQRGMELGWPEALELITRSLDAASPDERRRIYSGAGTDHLDPTDARSPDDVVRAYLQQIAAIQRRDGRIILMASRALARIARGPADYETVYRRVLAECDRPVILHWLGEMFDPALRGYWGAKDFADTLETALAVIGASGEKIDGIKISLLDADKEIAMRRRLPGGVKMYTGDDFNYPELIKGDAAGFSHALLGIFDPIAPAAAVALSALREGNAAEFDRVMAPTVPLSRMLFRAPTRFYKTGVVFLAYLNGFQNHFVMIGGAQAMRPLPYFCGLFRLADAAGLLRDPDLATTRMRRLLAVYGITD
jgi:Protein of unknown function (DUF993)